MEENMELLKKMEANSRKQLNYSRIQCLFSVITAVCCAAMLIAVLQLMPAVTELAGQAETILANLETVTGELAKIDLAGTVSNINTLVTASQTAVGEATEKLNAIDLETLNAAIEDLANVIKPLANAAKWFG